MYKTIHLYEIKLLDGTIHRGEIVNRDKDGIHLDLLTNQKIYFNNNAIMLIRDLGWKKVKVAKNTQP